MRKIKRITSVILAALMITSLFVAVPMTANRGLPPTPDPEKSVLSSLP